MYSCARFCFLKTQMYVFGLNCPSDIKWIVCLFYLVDCSFIISKKRRSARVFPQEPRINLFSLGKIQHYD